MLMTIPPATTPLRSPTNDAESALVELHRILFPQAHHNGADAEPWTADTLHELEAVIVRSTERLGLARTPE